MGHTPEWRRAQSFALWRAGNDVYVNVLIIEKSAGVAKWHTRKV